MSASIPRSLTGLYCNQHARELEPVRWDGEGWMPIPMSEEALSTPVPVPAVQPRRELDSDIPQAVPAINNEAFVALTR